MGEVTDSLTFSAVGSWTAELTPEFSSFGATSSFTINGLSFTRGPFDMLFRTGRYVGNEVAPQDIKRLRRSAYELFRRMGQPVIVKHMFTDEDRLLGSVVTSPNFDSIYGQVRNEDPFSYGTGFVSIELSENEWIDPGDGSIYTSDTSPGAGWVQAPKYRGFGPGYLTWLIRPDAADDYFKLSPQGALIRVQTANAVAPWYPAISDNDLIVVVELDRSGRVVATRDRFQAKLTNPVSIRGTDRRGRSEFSGDQGNSHLVNQVFPMTLVPTNNILMRVDTDR